jgi:hypothetical protein
MLSPQALIKGLVARALPTPNTDSQNTDVGGRYGRYGENTVLSYVRKQHLLADEGAYFTASNAQTAITGPAAAGFVATTPALVIYNGASSSGPRIYLDYLYLLNGGTAFSNSTSNTGMFWALLVDAGNRFSSGGTASLQRIRTWIQGTAASRPSTSVLLQQRRHPAQYVPSSVKGYFVSPSQLRL